MPPLTIISTAIIVWFAAAGLVTWYRFRKRLTALWREPVLRFPVLIIESDDWGPGPDEHAQALQRLSRLLAGFRDKHGRHAVMTLGMVLAVPDTNAMRKSGLRTYHRLPLSDPRFTAIREAIASAVDAGVFAPQLHGIEHYWPPAVVSQAQAAGTIRGWLTQDELPNSEKLPPPLQSRWADCSELPSKPISDDAIAAAVGEEVAAFTELFGGCPEVVVPPTFLWNDVTERAWAKAGVQILVTPGARFEARNARGVLNPSSRNILNAERGQEGIIYMVRDDYFEPAKGHRAERAIAAVVRKTARGRPTLLETHRFNFTGAPETAKQAANELARMLEEVLKRFPDVWFVSTAQLAKQLVSRSPELVETRLRARMRVWLLRAGDVSGLRRFVALTGLALLLFVVGAVVLTQAGR